MERVAEPAPSLALTTSSPPNWTPVSVSAQLFPKKKKTNLLTVHESIQLVTGNAHGGLSLAEKRDNGLARVSANDGNSELVGFLLACDGGNECLSTNDVEGGDTEQLLWVENAGLLEDLGGDGDGRVHGVGDDKHVSLGGVLCNALDEALDDTGVDLEEVITGHTGLA